MRLAIIALCCLMLCGCGKKEEEKKEKNYTEEMVLFNGRQVRVRTSLNGLLVSASGFTNDQEASDFMDYYREITREEICE